MEIANCSNCGKPTGHKKWIGGGTVIAVIFTSGIWLLAILFYPKRCVLCGLTQDETQHWNIAK